MVRATLDGRKTQTRRVLKPQPLPNVNGWDWSWPIPGKNVTPGTRDYWRNDAKNPIAPRYCPHGQPGDRLWVRETHYAFGRWETRHSAKKGRDEWHFVDLTLDSGREYQYPDTFEPVAMLPRGDVTPSWWKRPAIFMPRAASRIAREIVSVRVERLNDCSEADALAEGVTATPDGAFHIEQDMYRAPDPVECYARLWAAINGDGAWTANPWVWVVEFRRV
ncbi:hypothetical protein [Cupriavidus sp. OTU4054]